MVWLAPLIVAVLVGGVLALPDGRNPLKAGQADISPGPGGVVEVVSRSGATRSLTHTARLDSGDALTVRQGVAKITVADGSVLVARAGRRARPDSSLRLGRTPELTAGDLLVRTPDHTTVQSSGTDVTAVATGDPAALRLTKTLAVGVGVYAGKAEVDSAGARGAVRALRAIEVASLGELPAHPAALQIRTSDPWDRRYLAAAIDIDQNLGPLTATFDRTGASEDVRPASLGNGVPDQAELNRLRDAARRMTGSALSPSQTLIASAIAALGQRGTFASRWSSAFRFRAQGATWGLVATDQGVNARALLGRIRDVIDVLPSPLRALAAPVPTPQPSTPTGGSAPAATGSAPAGGAAAGTPSAVGTAGTADTSGAAAASPTGGTGSSPLVTVPPVTVPPPTGSSNIVGDTVDTVTGLLGGLLGVVPQAGSGS